MARNTIQHENTPPEGGKVEMGGVPIMGLESVPNGVIPSDAPVLKGSVVKPSADAPKPKRYTVMKQCAALLDGTRVVLAEGKVVDDSNYDIDYLRRIGAKLQPYTEE
jgi:hypothetical protein